MSGNLIVNPGNVGIGTASPSQPLHVASSTSAAIALQDNAGTANNRIFDWSVSGGTLYGRAVDDAYGAATSYMEVNRTGTTINSVNLPNGNIGMGITAQAGTKLNLAVSASVGFICAALRTGPNGADTTSYYLNFTDYAGAVGVGGVVRNGTNTVAYGTSSDERLKETIEDTSLGLDALMDIRVCDYVFKAGGEQVHGLIAQQVQGIYPYAVHEGGDDPQLEPWLIDYGRLTPLLIKAIQELSAKVAALEAAE